MTAENKLWNAVLTQAFKDAESKIPHGFRQTQSPKKRKEIEAKRKQLEQIRNAAQLFLSAASPGFDSDLRRVCEFAGISVDRVMSAARKRYGISKTVAA